MIQGTGSNVGKSMLVAGIARALANRGLSVAPFKPQNMSNNAAVTSDGGEIGRAQALQAMAARRTPHSDMNPVLLKPESETGAQVIVQGKRAGQLEARDYTAAKPNLLPITLESFHRLAQSADIVLIEGAGSPAEVNLRAGDIANMGFAQAANVPVVLLGDIDRGGVIAQIVGTKAVLSPADGARIKGFAINKFRGDVALFDGGLAAITQHTGWPSLGVLPWFRDAWRLPAEDMMDLCIAPSGGTYKIAVPHLSRIANFDDLDPLTAEPNVAIEIIAPGRPLPGDADLVLIPGTKSTIADLAFFRAQGWDIDLAAHLRRRGHVLGICGGFQMLGKRISDPDAVEGPPATVSGLGHLDVETLMQAEKNLALHQARYLPTGAAVDGYEIHMGETTGPDCTRPWLDLAGRPHGATSPDGLVMGCYLHGLFRADAFRADFLTPRGATISESYDAQTDAVLDRLGAHIAAHLDLDLLLEMAGTV